MGPDSINCPSSQALPHLTSHSSSWTLAHKAMTLSFHLLHTSWLLSMSSIHIELFPIPLFSSVLFRSSNFSFPSRPPCQSSLAKPQKPIAIVAADSRSHSQQIKRTILHKGVFKCLFSSECKNTLWHYVMCSDVKHTLIGDIYLSI